MTRLFLGVDAGNSKTVALVATVDGAVVGRGRAGTGDIYGSGGADGAVREVVAASRAALAAAPSPVEGAAFRLAGVDWPEDEVFWRAALEAALPELPSLTVRNDGFSLLRLGANGMGVSALAGTGGAIAARGPTGESSMSFWIQDDLGAHGLGAQAVRAVVRAELGIAPPTALAAALIEHFGVEDVEGLLHSFTRRVEPRSPWSRATASRAVIATATAGDAVAANIVSSQATRFGENIVAAARRVGFVAADPVAVLLGGALVTAGQPLYREALSAATASLLPAAEVRIIEEPAVIGAVLDALAENGVPPSAEVRERLKAAAHPSDFLLT